MLRNSIYSWVRIPWIILLCCTNIWTFTDRTSPCSEIHQKFKILLEVEAFDLQPWTCHFCYNKLYSVRRYISCVSGINYTFPNSTGTPLNCKLVIKSRQKGADLIIHLKGGDDFSRTELSCQNMSSLVTILQEKKYELSDTVEYCPCWNCCVNWKWNLNSLPLYIY